MQGWNGTQYLNGVVRWSAVDPAFDGTHSTYSSWNYLTNGYSHHFRLMGLAEEVFPNPATLTDKWVDLNSRLTTTATDEPAVSFVEAVDSGFRRGGHLPTHQEMMMLIQAGLPNGSNNWLWTSEFHSGDLVGVIRWAGIASNFTGYYSTFMSYSSRAVSTLQSFRIVYYPIDQEYTGPATESGQGGLYSVTNKAARIWSDLYDRTPATFAEAVKICHNLGGHLATKRDMLELIRSGLPNGYNHWVWTADKAAYSEVEVVRWSAVNTNFQDVYGATADSYQLTNNAATTAPFRCVWTNELRVH